MKTLMNSILVLAVLASAGSTMAGERYFSNYEVRPYRTTPYRTTLKRVPSFYGSSSLVNRYMDSRLSARRVSFQEPAPMPMPEAAPAVEGSVQLYPCVRYEDLHNIHPCAVRKVVAVADPCHDRKSCCAPKMVYVEICVPPCGCVRVTKSYHGNKVKYDYGKYEVEIKSKHGVVYVDYDD